MLDPSRVIFWRKKKNQVSVGFGALVEQWQVIGTFFNKFPERARHNSFSFFSLTSLHLFNMFHIVMDMNYKHSFTYYVFFRAVVMTFVEKKMFFSKHKYIVRKR